VLSEGGQQFRRPIPMKAFDPPSKASIWHRVAKLLPTFESTMHFTGNQYVKVDGNVAFAEHYCRAFHGRSALAMRPQRIGW